VDGEGKRKIETNKTTTNNMPATKPACTEKFKRDVPAFQAGTARSPDLTASHFGTRG
jgi:hypothetical protein